MCDVLMYGRNFESVAYKSTEKTLTRNTEDRISGTSWRPIFSLLVVVNGKWTDDYIYIDNNNDKV